MNFYIRLMNETVDYIEENIHKRLSLEEVSKTFHMSEYHFNRMFKTVVGKTLKQYILGRKLTLALESLRNSSKPVIDVAYDFGFEYPEVFSRAFSRQFGISPAVCRIESSSIETIQKAVIIEREIANYQGVLTLRGESRFLEGLELKGTYIEVDSSSKEFESTLRATGEEFFIKAAKAPGFNGERFYTVVNCHGEDDGTYTVFYGMENNESVNEVVFKSRLVPAGWYESFCYRGDMFDIREAFVDDLYRWVMVKEIKLSPNGVGMLNIYEKDYPMTNEVQILVPIIETA